MGQCAAPVESGGRSFPLKIRTVSLHTAIRYEGIDIPKASRNCTVVLAAKPSKAACSSDRFPCVVEEDPLKASRRDRAKILVLIQD